MFSPFKRLELEWKILLLAFLLFAALLWPVQSLMQSRFDQAVALSVDPGLETLLRDGMNRTNDAAFKEAYVESLARHKEWQAMIDILKSEQRAAINALTILLMLFLLSLAAFTLRRLTRPLKTLASAAEQIGRGETPVIPQSGGGALGRLEQAMSSMESELSRLRGRLLAQGMEQAWRDIARVMAHEIKNPLTPVRLTLDRIDERLREGKTLEPSELARFLARITEQVDQLERLVVSFGSFAKEPEVRTAPFDPCAILDNTADGLKSRLSVTVSGNGFVSGDSLLFQQAVLNLFKNAVEAGAREMKIRLSPDKNRIRMVFTDNGPGMTASQLEKAFVPYVTYKPGGTGLGLAVVKRLIESMNGTVTLESAAGKGLSVHIMLPAADSKESP